MGVCQCHCEIICSFFKLFERCAFNTFFGLQLKTMTGNEGELKVETFQLFKWNFVTSEALNGFLLKGQTTEKAKIDGFGE